MPSEQAAGFSQAYDLERGAWMPGGVQGVKI